MPRVPLLVAAVLFVLAPGPAGAHEVRRVGPVDVTVGWAQEPPYAGLANGVQVVVSRGGQPMEEGVRLEAEVVFGQADAQARTQPIPLDPVAGRPGEFVGGLIPTRPGTYSFHVSGQVDGRRFDETFTSGQETFDDVLNPAASQFPITDPTAGELSLRLDRMEARIREVQARLGSLDTSDPVARWMASGAAALVLVGLVVLMVRRSDG
jgi:hypothetical protein